MPCPKTSHLATEYFDDSLPQLAREEIERHLSRCVECAAEMESLKDVQQRLSLWKDEQVPHWDRGTGLYLQEHGRTTKRPAWLWQWLPTAVSVAMFVILTFSMNISNSSDGFVVSFGSSRQAADNVQLNQRLTEFARAQQTAQNQALQAFLATMDDRQDSNYRRLIQAVSEQTQQQSADSFDRIYAYFEQQRQLDLENVQVSYQQLVDRDFETFQSMQQLANFVRFQGEPR